MLLSVPNPKSMGVDKSAVTLSLFDMHLALDRQLWEKTQSCVGGHPTMFVYKLLPTPPLSLWQVTSFFGFTLEHNGKGRKNRGR